MASLPAPGMPQSLQCSHGCPLQRAAGLVLFRPSLLAPAMPHLLCCCIGSILRSSCSGNVPSDMSSYPEEQACCIAAPPVTSLASLPLPVSLRMRSQRRHFICSLLIVPQLSESDLLPRKQVFWPPGCPVPAAPMQAWAGLLEEWAQDLNSKGTGWGHHVGSNPKLCTAKPWRCSSSKAVEGLG